MFKGDHQVVLQKHKKKREEEALSVIYSVHRCPVSLPAHRRHFPSFSLSQPAADHLRPIAHARSFALSLRSSLTRSRPPSLPKSAVCQIPAAAMPPWQPRAPRRGQLSSMDLSCSYQLRWVLFDAVILIGLSVVLFHHRTCRNATLAAGSRRHVHPQWW